MANFPDIKSPRYPMQVQQDYGIETHRTMDDALQEQRIKIRSSVYKKITVSWRYLTSTDKGLLEDFFDSMDSLYDSFTLTDFWDSDVSYTARFDTTEISSQYFVNDFWNSQTLSFIIIEEL